MVELSKDANNIGIISVVTSSAGVFSIIKCKFSSKVTVACIDLGPFKMILKIQQKNRILYNFFLNKYIEIFM